MGFLSHACKDWTWRDIGSIPSCLFLVLPPNYNCCVKPGVGGQALSRLGPKALACPPLHPWAPLAQGSFPWKWKVGLALGPNGLWRSQSVSLCWVVLAQPRGVGAGGQLAPLSLWLSQCLEHCPVSHCVLRAHTGHTLVSHSISFNLPLTPHKTLIKC